MIALPGGSLVPEILHPFVVHVRNWLLLAEEEDAREDPVPTGAAQHPLVLVLWGSELHLRHPFTSPESACIVG